jgi:predicted transcriptional regulator
MPPKNDNLNRTTLLAQYFGQIAYRVVVTTTRSCPLSRKQIEVYSPLIKAKYPVSVARLAKVTALTRKTVKRNLEALGQHGLAKLEGDRWIVQPPKNEQVKWFAWKRKGDDWRTRIRRWKILRRSSESKLTDAENTIYSMLLSVAGAEPIVEISVNRLAKLARVVRKTVRKALARLVEQGLIKKGTGRIKLLEPGDLGNWQEIKKKEIKPPKPQVEPVEIISVPAGYYSRAMAFAPDSLAAITADYQGERLAKATHAKPTKVVSWLKSLYDACPVYQGERMLFDMGTLPACVNDWLRDFDPGRGLSMHQWIDQSVARHCKSMDRRPRY